MNPILSFGSLIQWIVAFAGGLVAFVILLRGLKLMLTRLLDTEFMRDVEADRYLEGKGGYDL